jgi:DnaJ-class molecular chaperone
MNNYSMEICAWCGGSRTWTFSMGNKIACPVCGGVGRVQVSQPSRRCHQCEGSGKHNLTTPCLTCAGTGWQHVVGQG